MTAEASGARWTTRLALGLGGLLAVAVLFGVVEGTLRLTGLGDPAEPPFSQLKYQQVFFPMLEPGVRPDGTAVLATNDPRVPYQQLLADKPEGGLRVFTFGGSATAGLGFSPNVTFARHLERMLAAAEPGRPLEVVNLGIVALSSKQVKLLVEHVARHFEPDALIVYSGNNEFLELHAQKYVRARSGFAEGLGLALADTNLGRLLEGAVRGPPRAPARGSVTFSTDDLRLTQSSIITSIETSEDDVAAVLDRYQANMERIAEVAAEHDVPLLLCTVGVNWEWRGKQDLAPGWLSELLDEPGLADDTPDETPDEAVWRRAVAALDEELEAAARDERWEWLYRRALAHERLGETAAARDDFRASMNADPHYRRALDAGNERLRRVAEAHGVPVFDTVAFLADRAPDGIVGFDEYYDYVHFTPRGAALTASGLVAALHEMGLVSDPGSDPGAAADEIAARYVAGLDGLARDLLDAREFLGVTFDTARIQDRNLWKYEEALDDLDARLESDPDDVPARIWRGCARSFRLDGAAGALDDWRAALELDPGLEVVRENVRRLQAQRSR